MQLKHQLKLHFDSQGKNKTITTVNCLCTKNAILTAMETTKNSRIKAGLSDTIVKSYYNGKLIKSLNYKDNLVEI